jgi:hypothetical protein
MKPESQDLAVAKSIGEYPQFVLKKRGLYYRPEGCGYTSDISGAGRYSEEDAKKQVYPHDEPVTMHSAPVEPYGRCVNSMRRALKTLGPAHRRKFIGELCVICDREFGNSEIDPSDVFDPNEMSQMFLIDAGPELYREAYLRTLNLWNPDA